MMGMRDNLFAANRWRYDRSINLLCPTCGGSQFAFDEGADETITLAKCASCGRETTKDELARENSESISEHVKEMGKEITRDLADEFRQTLTRSFGGSKFITIK